MEKKILIVEDEQNIVDILSFNLEREGYDTIEAYDGPTGLKLALEENPDLILLDLMLPGMDGFDVCRQIRRAGHATPILMLTAREEEADKVLGLELGADDYITKPFSMRELLARVKANIRRVGMVPAAPQGEEPAAAAMKLGLPADIAAGLPHMEVNGFQECSVDRHTGILEYNEERIVIGLNIGCLVVTGHALQIQRMHRERLTITGRITCLTYGDGGTAGCGG